MYDCVIREQRASIHPPPSCRVRVALSRSLSLYRVLASFRGSSRHRATQAKCAFLPANLLGLGVPIEVLGMHVTSHSGYLQGG